MLSGLRLMTFKGHRCSHFFCYDNWGTQQTFRFCPLLTLPSRQKPKDLGARGLFCVSFHRQKKRERLLESKHTDTIHHYLMRPGVCGIRVSLSSAFQNQLVWWVHFHVGPVRGFPAPCSSVCHMLSNTTLFLTPQPNLGESPGTHSNKDMILRGTQILRCVFLNLIYCSNSKRSDYFGTT